MGVARRTGIVLGVMLMFGAVMALTVDWDYVDNPFDLRYTPLVKTYVKAGKGPLDLAPSLRSVWSEVGGATAYGFQGCWFCTGTKVSLEVTGPQGYYVTTSDGPYGIDYNAEKTFQLEWRAKDSAGRYTLKVKVFEVDNDGRPTGNIFGEKTCYVEIGEEAATTNTPQTCM